MKTKNSISVLVMALVVAMFSQSAYATWGDYDPTFGFLGMAIDNVANHHPGGVAVQADGKILVTGYKIFAGRARLFLRRYLSNGVLDTSFGNNGAAMVSNPFIINADYYGSRIVLQADGRIVIAGRGDSRPAIWRFMPSGSADTTMGPGGMKVLYAYEGNGAPAIASHLNILYVGVVDAQSSSSRILKFNSDGTQDISFGANGEAITDANDSFSIAVDPTSGNVLAGGRRRSNLADFGVQRFLSTGVADPTFTHWGGTNNTWPTIRYDFLRKSNGQFVMNERVYNITGGGVTVHSNLVRLAAAGNFTSKSEYEHANILAYVCPEVLAEQQDGKVIMTGASAEKLYRFAANFSTIQMNSCTAYSLMDSWTPAVLQSDDKMLVAGRYNGNLVIVRTIP